MSEGEEQKREIVSESAILRLRDASSVFDLARHDKKIETAWSEVRAAFERYHFLINIKELEEGILFLTLGDTSVRNGGLVLQVFGANKNDLLINFETGLRDLLSETRHLSDK